MAADGIDDSKRQRVLRTWRTETETPAASPAAAVEFKIDSNSTQPHIDEHWNADRADFTGPYFLAFPTIEILIVIHI